MTTPTPTAPLPYRYDAYGTLLSSACELPGLPVAGQTRPTRQINLRWDGPDTTTTAADVRLAGYAESPGEAVTWTLPGVVELALTGVSPLIVECVARGRAELVAHFFVRSVIAQALSMLGMGYLRASAVSWSGQAIVVVGPSACGKSTAAAALVSAGCDLLSDHGAAYIVEASQPLSIHRGLSEYQLYTDSLPSPEMRSSAERLPGGARYRIVADSCAKQPAPLGAVLVPNYARKASSSSLRLICGVDRLRALLWAGGGASGSIESAALLRCAAQVPVYALDRPPVPRQRHLHQNLQQLFADWLVQLQESADFSRAQATRDG